MGSTPKSRKNQLFHLKSELIFDKMNGTAVREFWVGPILKVGHNDILEYVCNLNKRPVHSIYHSKVICLFNSLC